MKFIIAKTENLCTLLKQWHLTLKFSAINLLDIVFFKNES